MVLPYGGTSGALETELPLNFEIFFCCDLGTLTDSTENKIQYLSIKASWMFSLHFCQSKSDLNNSLIILFEHLKTGGDIKLCWKSLKTWLKTSTTKERWREIDSEKWKKDQTNQVFEKMMKRLDGNLSLTEKVTAGYWFLMGGAKPKGPSQIIAAIVTFFTPNKMRRNIFIKNIAANCCKQSLGLHSCIHDIISRWSIYNQPNSWGSIIKQIISAHERTSVMRLLGTAEGVLADRRSLERQSDKVSSD